MLKPPVPVHATTALLLSAGERNRVRRSYRRRCSDFFRALKMCHGGHRRELFRRSGMPQYDVSRAVCERSSLGQEKVSWSGPTSCGRWADVKKPPVEPYVFPSKRDNSRMYIDNARMYQKRKEEKKGKGKRNKERDNECGVLVRVPSLKARRSCREGTSRRSASACSRIPAHVCLRHDVTTSPTLRQHFANASMFRGLVSSGWADPARLHWSTIFSFESSHPSFSCSPYISWTLPLLGLHRKHQACRPRPKPAPQPRALQR